MQNETLLISSGVGSGNLLTCILQILVQIKKNVCYNRRNRNTLISVTNFDNKYRRMKRVLEAKTSFAYEYIFLVRGGEEL